MGELSDTLDAAAERVIDRASFITFLEAFRADLEAELARPEHETAWGAGRWSHPTLEGFLDALAAYVADHHNARTEIAVNHDRLDAAGWSTLADILMGARIYE
jgi:hypothetical protein